jgi:hypothetical protein
MDTADDIVRASLQEGEVMAYDVHLSGVRYHIGPDIAGRRKWQRKIAHRRNIREG